MGVGGSRVRAEASDLYYAPSIRETIAFARMLNNGMSPREVAKLVFKIYQYAKVNLIE